MILYPNAKINLGLQVLRKRPDGYHDIETLFYPISLCDILEVIDAPEGTFSFSFSGLSVPGDQESNLCVRAYKSLQVRNLPVAPVKIHLHKQIPAGSGLGGGSSDAAFTLHCMNGMFRLGLSDRDLTMHAATLGSDCAFFILNRPALATGRGEVLSPVDLNLNGFFLALVIPPVNVSTILAYSLVKPAMPEAPVREVIRRHPPGRWKDLLKNDFEGPVFREFPVIREVKEKMYEMGAVYASMSGTGAAVYGLFNSPPDLHSRFPEHFLLYTAKLL